MYTRVNTALFWIMPIHFSEIIPFFQVRKVRVSLASSRENRWAASTSPGYKWAPDNAQQYANAVRSLTRSSFTTFYSPNLSVSLFCLSSAYFLTQSSPLFLSMPSASATPSTHTIPFFSLCLPDACCPTGNLRSRGALLPPSLWSVGGAGRRRDVKTGWPTKAHSLPLAASPITFFRRKIAPHNGNMNG